MKNAIILICLLFSSFAGFSQVGIGTKNPDSTAVLDLSSTSKGALFPRMTTAQRTAITSPAIGLTVFDLDKKAYWYYTGTEWVEMTTNKDEWTDEDNGNSRANEDWNTQGNTNVGGEFIGTTNNQPLLIKTNGSERMRVAGNGNVGIGNANPHAPLQFANLTGNRKIVLWEVGNNDHQFYGLGINGGSLRYQLSDTLNQHIFYAGVNGTTSKELMRIKGNGNVGIGTTTPAQKLHVNGSAFISENLGVDVSDPKEHLEVGDNGRAFFGDGQGNTRKGLLIDGIEGTNASRIEAYDYGIPGGRNLVINTIGHGNVGIGVSDPQERLEVGGNGRAFFGDGAGVTRSGLLIDGIESANASRIEAFNYDSTGGTSRNLIINTSGGGNVGIGTHSPTEKLHVNGNIKVEGSIINDPYTAIDTTTFGLGFQNAGGAYAPAGFYKDKENCVHLRGMVKWFDSIQPVIFTLPEGSRPAYEKFFVVYNGNNNFCALEVSSGGVVYMLTGFLENFSLDQISFRADQ